MFWSLVLPFKITFWVFVIILTVATSLAPRFHQSRKRIFTWGACLTILLFAPSCSMIMRGLDHFRFGTFQYSTIDEVNDFRIKRYLPVTATEITVVKSPSGFTAKFKIDQQSLEQWQDELWEKWGEFAAHPREQEEEFDMPESLMPSLPTYYGELNWPPLEKPIKYEGPRAENGTGYTIWFSESDGIAYQGAGYF